MENNETLHVIPTLIPFVLVIFVIALGVVLLNFQFRKNLFKTQLEQEELKRVHQKKILENTVKIQEEERRRIAQDLHDELGAVLSICKMRLVSLENNYARDLSDFLELKEYLGEALKSTRRISRELMPIQLEQLGLRKSLLSFAHFAEESSEIEINTEIDINHIELNASVQLGVYRIHAELINNSMKHANATNIRSRIDTCQEGISIVYEDDGKGIDLEQFESGLGMMSMNNRIEYLGGSWKYGNKSKGGFCAEIIVPFSNELL